MGKSKKEAVKPQNKDRGWSGVGQGGGNSLGNSEFSSP